jgi:hypothetical protein
MPPAAECVRVHQSERHRAADGCTRAGADRGNRPAFSCSSPCLSLHKAFFFVGVVRCLVDVWRFWATPRCCGGGIVVFSVRVCTLSAVHLCTGSECMPTLSVSVLLRGTWNRDPYPTPTELNDSTLSGV